MSSQTTGVTEVLQNLNQATTDNRVTIGELMDALGSRSYGPFLLIPALIDISPIGSIPGLPTILALTIILFSGQILLGQQHLWIPQVLSNRTISTHRVQRATRAIKPLARWLDKIFHKRLQSLVQPPFIQVAAAGCILLALTVPPLEIIPLASTVPMGAIAMVGLALMVGDGLLMLAALAFTLFAGLTAFGFAI